MRVLFFSDLYLPKVDGVVTSSVALAEALEGQGHEAMMVAPGQKLFQFESASFDNPSLVLVASFPAMIYMELRVGVVAHPKNWKKIHEFNADIVHVHTCFVMGILGVIYAKIFHLPVVATHHVYFTNRDHDFFRSLTKNAALRKFLTGVSFAYLDLFYSFVDAVICPSPSLPKMLADEGHDWKMVSVPNIFPAVKLPKLSEKEKNDLRKKLGLSGQTLISVSRLSGDKYVEVAIKAFKKVLESRPDTKFLVIGNGPDKKLLETLSKRLGLSGKIIFTGFWKHDEMIASGVLSLADVFVTASPMENQSMAIIEAMTFGLPIVGVTRGGIIDQVKENGILVSPGNSSEMAEAVVKILGSSATRKKMSEESKKMAKKYEAKFVVPQMLKVYGKLI